MTATPKKPGSRKKAASTTATAAPRVRKKAAAVEGTEVMTALAEPEAAPAAESPGGDPIALSPAQEYAYGLVEAALRLDQAKEAGEIAEAMAHNLVAWIYLKTVINKNGTLPEELRANVTRLADFVTSVSMQDGHSVTAEQIQSLIGLNLQISEGLLEGEATHQTRERAYYLWQEAGCPHGRDMEFWLAAEREVEGVAARELITA